MSALVPDPTLAPDLLYKNAADRLRPWDRGGVRPWADAGGRAGSFGHGTFALRSAGGPEPRSNPKTVLRRIRDGGNAVTVRMLLDQPNQARFRQPSGSGNKVPIDRRESTCSGQIPGGEGRSLSWER